MLPLVAIILDQVHHYSEILYKQQQQMQQSVNKNVIQANI